jgi:hypothetical protein
MARDISDGSTTGQERLIALETQRYSTMFRRILETYGAGALIEIDGKKHGERDLPQLLQDWCTNARIEKTMAFVLEREGRPLFGFHDHPSETWAAVSELDFVDGLRRDGIVRYRIHPVRRSVLTEPLSRLLVRLWHRFTDRARGN